MALLRLLPPLQGQCLGACQEVGAAGVSYGSLPGRGPVPGGGRRIPTISPGSAWPARNPPWYRRLQGRRYNSFALATFPRNSRHGGRERAGPSSLTGACDTVVPSPVCEAHRYPSIFCMCDVLSGRGAFLAFPGGVRGFRVPWSCVVAWSRGTLAAPRSPEVTSLLPPFRYQLQRDGSLIISPLRPEDAGTYSCGSHGPGHEPQKIQLQVTGSCPIPFIPTS